jgi:hypothetical protein
VTEMSANSGLLSFICGIALCGATLAGADDEEGESEDMTFLEYLGFWEESDEEWQLFDDNVVAEYEEQSDPVPKGEDSAEIEDES